MNAGAMRNVTNMMPAPAANAHLDRVGEVLPRGAP
jgi:hypothetical protein